MGAGLGKKLKRKFDEASSVPSMHADVLCKELQLTSTLYRTTFFLKYKCSIGTYQVRLSSSRVEGTD